MYDERDEELAAYFENKYFELEKDSDAEICEMFEMCMMRAPSSWKVKYKLKAPMEEACAMLLYSHFKDEFNMFEKYGWDGVLHPEKVRESGSSNMSDDNSITKKQSECVVDIWKDIDVRGTLAKVCACNGAIAFDAMNQCIAQWASLVPAQWRDSYHADTDDKLAYLYQLHKAKPEVLEDFKIRGKEALKTKSSTQQKKQEDIWDEIDVDGDVAAVMKCIGVTEQEDVTAISRYWAGKVPIEWRSYYNAFSDMKLAYLYILSKLNPNVLDDFRTKGKKAFQEHKII